MKKGSSVIPPGAQVRIGTTSSYFLVDGLGKMYKVPSQTQAKALGLPSARVVKKAEMASYKRSGPIGGVRLTCEGKPYLVVAGKYYPVSVETHSHYPLASRTLDDSTCSTLNLLTTQGSRFIRDSSMNYFLVEDGKKRPLANKAQYQALRGDSPKYLVVDSYFASKIPTGKKVPLKTSAIEDEAATEAPGGSTESSAKVYYVVSGDTLSGIASRFKTTSAILAKLNNISDPSSIRVGQKLNLP
jgi:LysM repeat protein